MINLITIQLKKNILKSRVAMILVYKESQRVGES
jgi:hypothetical protein